MACIALVSRQPSWLSTSVALSASERYDAEVPPISEVYLDAVFHGEVNHNSSRDERYYDMTNHLHEEKDIGIFQE